MDSINCKRALVCGSSGFVGTHMVKKLQGMGYYVYGIDIKKPPYVKPDKFIEADLREEHQVDYVFDATDVDEVYDLAANMGGMGWLNNRHADILYDNAMINLNLLNRFKDSKVKFFFSSSACAYPGFKQTELNAVPLKESDAYPAWPDMAYGWEKLFTEQACAGYREDYGLDAHVARFHATYGPLGSWMGGREKAPAALCRKIAIAKLRGQREIEIWGDGEQQRTFTYVDDNVEGIYRLTQSDFPGPLNIGSTEVTTINNMAHMIADIAGWTVMLKHVEGPQGVRSRNSDNTLCKEILGWEPTISLYDGLSKTYPWIEGQVAAHIEEL